MIESGGILRAPGAQPDSRRLLAVTVAHRLGVPVLTADPGGVSGRATVWGRPAARAGRMTEQGELAMQRLDELLALEDAEKALLGVRYTAGEIAAQPELWVETAERMLPHRERLAELLEGAEQVILTGSGSSFYIGRSLERALSRSLDQHVQAVAGTEIVMDPDGTLPRRPFVLVSFARSGESPEGNAAFQLAERLRPGLVRQLVITCNAEGTLARLARESASPTVCCLMPPQTHDRGLAMTSSFTSMFVAALLLSSVDDAEGYRRVVTRLAEAGRAILKEYAGALAEAAQLPFTRACFVGSGALYGAALEAHLKVQELSDGIVMGLAEETLGFRHGPMSALNGPSLFGLFASGDPYRRQYESDLLREVAEKGLGLIRLVVCPFPEPDWLEQAQVVIAFDPERRLNLPDDVTAPLPVVAAQLVALHKSLALGLKPDAPSRRGVIHRVVQGVRIYPFAANETA